MENKSKIRHIVIDNFYEDPLLIRDFALKQTYEKDSRLPRFHTIKQFATEDHKIYFEKIIEPYNGKITDFYCSIFNGTFQYSLPGIVPWVHYDDVDWAAIIYLTPEASECCGTSFYAFEDGTQCEKDEIENNNSELSEKYNSDITRWKLIDSIGNIFNRLVIYDAKYFHKPSNYFGTELKNSRLFQVFFFNTEIHN